MGDFGPAKSDETKPIGTPSQAGSTTPSVAADVNQDLTSGDKPRSRPNSRAPDSGRLADIPKRPDIRQQVHPPVRPPPRHGDGRLPPRPEGLDDRRDRHPDFGPRGRHGGGPDHGRSFDGSLNDVRGRLNERLGDRDRDFPMRPPPGDDLMRGPPRDIRAGRENGWPMDRPGRMRGPGPGPNDSFHGRDGPVRGELMPDHMDRPVDLPRRADSSRPEKDDRRPYSQRPLSPSRPTDLPNRPERFPPPDDRRPPSFTGSSRIDDLPRGPRSDRQVDPRDSVSGPDLTHGRLRQPEPPTDIPAGPRGRRGGRNASGQPPINTSSANATTPLPDRQAPTGPSRQNGRVALEPPAAPSQPSGSTSAPGIHPDRLRLVNDAPPNAPPSGPRGGSTPQQVPRGPASSNVPSGPPGPAPPSGPAGAGFGGERGRGDKRFAGLNNMLQQSGGGGDRSGNPPPVRGRGANRQSSTMEAPPVQPPNRPPMGPAGPQDDQSRSRPNGGRVADLIDDVVVPESGRSGRTGDRNRESAPNREKDAERRDGSSSGRNRRDGRRSDRERSRRSDVGGGGSRDDKERTGEPRETLRRVQSSREELRRRDRRDRPDGPPEMAGPPPISSNAQEGEGRLRPPSSQGAPPPPPPPPMPAGNDRRFNAGGDRGPRNENRDRERERRGDRRDRDHHRDGGSGSGGGGSGHRKRARPGQEETPDGGRGMRMGNDNKRPRRGA